MTVTIAFLRNTRYHMMYEATHDGGGGDTATITNTDGGTPDFQSDLAFNGEQAPLVLMMETPVADDAAAILLIQGMNPGLVTLVPNSQVNPSGWSAQAIETGLLAELVITGTAALASSCLIYISRPTAYATP